MNDIGNIHSTNDLFNELLTSQQPYDADKQYPMIPVVFIIMSVAITCICVFSVRGWIRFTYTKKLQELAYEMQSQTKLNSRIHEMQATDTNIELFTPSSASNTTPTYDNTKRNNTHKKDHADTDESSQDIIIV
eukprot:151133_1